MEKKSFLATHCIHVTVAWVTIVSAWTLIFASDWLINLTMLEEMKTVGKGDVRIKKWEEWQKKKRRHKKRGCVLTYNKGNWISTFKKKSFTLCDLPVIIFMQILTAYVRRFNLIYWCTSYLVTIYVGVFMRI